MATTATPSGIGFTTASPKIMECTCTHEYQDLKYGRRQRVHNPNKNGYRCTVCDTQKGR